MQAKRCLGGDPGSSGVQTAESAMREGDMCLVSGQRPPQQEAYRALRRHGSWLGRAAGMHGATTAHAGQAPAALGRQVPRLQCAAGMHAAAHAWDASAALPCQAACLQVIERC